MKVEINVIISGKSKKFISEMGELNNSIKSGEFQRNLEYDSIADMENSAISPKCKVKATYKILEY